MVTEAARGALVANGWQIWEDFYKTVKFTTPNRFRATTITNVDIGAPRTSS
jgi:hypothetical protein